MVVNNRIFMYCIVLLFCIHFVSAGYLLSLSSNEEVYFPGDNILIDAEFKNPFDYSAPFSIEALLTNQKGDFPEAIYFYEFELGVNESKQITLYNFDVEEEMPFGDYLVKVKFLMDNKKISEENISFEIGGTLKKQDLSLNFCKSFSCEEKSNLFVVGEDVHILYNSDVEFPRINATLTYPDKNFKKINLPYEMKADKVGTYVLDVTVSKEGYRTVSRREQFAVIESAAAINSSFFQGAENSQSGFEFSFRGLLKYRSLFFVILGIVLVVIIFVVILVLRPEKVPLKNIRRRNS